MSNKDLIQHFYDMLTAMKERIISLVSSKDKGFLFIEPKNMVFICEPNRFELVEESAILALHVKDNTLYGFCLNMTFDLTDINNEDIIADWSNLHSAFWREIDNNDYSPSNICNIYKELFLSENNYINS